MSLMTALLLLLLPPEMPCESDPSLHQEYAETVRRLAIDLEILDPLETHVLAHPGEVAADLKTLRQRYRQFANAPSLGECARLPERLVVEEMLDVNRQFQKELKDRLLLDRVHAADLQAALAETEHLFRVWDAVREARCEYYYVTARRQALERLRNLIGMQAFCAGQLPPHVPLWRIPENHN